MLDQTLRQLNSDYDAKRHRDLALAPPQLTVAPLYTSDASLATKRELVGEHQVPRLSNSRELLDQMLLPL